MHTTEVEESLGLSARTAFTFLAMLVWMLPQRPRSDETATTRCLDLRSLEAKSAFSYRAMGERERGREGGRVEMGRERRGGMGLSLGMEEEVGRD